ncbi:7544_t:CDS:2, partial [Cetraspora pellucida]
IMIEAIENPKEIVRNAISLIWEATNGEVRKIVYDGQSHSATIFLDDGNNYDGNFFDTPGVVLISKETYRKTINDLANIKGKESIIVEDVVDVKIFIVIDYNEDLVNESQEDTLMIDAQTNKNDTGEDQRLKDSHMNDYFKFSKRKGENKIASKYLNVNVNHEQGENVNDFESNEEPDELLPDFHSSINVTVNTLETASVNDNQQPVSVISEMLENTTLANNITQTDESIRDNDHECEKGNSRKSKRVHLENHQRAKKNKRLKSDEIYKQVDISDSDDDSQNSDSDDSQNIRKKKARYRKKKSKTLEKSTPHRVEITSFPIVVVEQNERFSRMINNTQSTSQPSNLMKLDEPSDEYSNTQEIDEIRFNEAVEYEINSARNNE